MATPSSQFPFFTAPYAFPYPAPTQIHGYNYPSPFPYTSSSYPAPAPYPHNLWSTPSTPSESTFPTPTSFPACCYSSAPAASTFPYSQVHSPPPESTAPPTPTTFVCPILSQHHCDQIQHHQFPTPCYSHSPAVFTFPYTQVHVPPPESTTLLATGAPANAATTTTALLCRPDHAAHADLSYSKADEVCTFQASDGDYSASPTTPHAKVPSFPCIAEKKGSVCQAKDLGRQLPNWWFDSLQDELSKMRERLSSLTTSMVPSSASSTSTTPMIASVPATSASTVPSTTAHAALQAFDEMPTPISWQGTHGKAPNYCSGHPNPIQSCVSNVNEQSLDVMPQQYDFNNLNRHSVFLADGSEHSYFALPENYPLERAVPEPVFDVYADKTEHCSKVFVDVLADSHGQSNAFVDVLASLHDQQTYEEQREPEHPTKCFSRASETEQTSAHGSYYAIEQNGETASVNVLQLRAPRLDLLEIEEMRKEWDTESNSLKYMLQSVSHPPMLSYSFLLRYYSVNGNSWLNTVRQSMRDHVEGLNPLSLTTPWDPGDARLHVLFTTASNLSLIAEVNTPPSGSIVMVAIAVYEVDTEEVEVKVDSGKPILGPERSNDGVFSFTIEKKSDSELLAVCFNNASDNAFSEKAADFTCPHAPVIYADRSIKLTNEKSNQATSTPCLHEVIVHCHDERSEHINCTNGIETIQLDFEQEDILISGVVSTVVNSEALEFGEKWDPVLMLKCHSWCRTLNGLLQVQYCCFPIVLDCPYSEPTQQLVCYYSMFSLTETIYSALSMSTTTVCMILVMSCGKIAQEEKDVAALYAVLKIQLQMSKTSRIWDPGVKIYLYSWLNILTVWSETDEPLSCTHISDLAAWHNQSVGSGTSYIWDPGTILWYTFVSVSNTLNAYYLAVRHSNGRSIYYLENIMCYLPVSTILEEKEMSSGQSIRFRSFRLAPMQRNDYQTCNSLSFQQHSHQDITFCEIALWLIHFQPP